MKTLNLNLIRNAYNIPLKNDFMSKCNIQRRRYQHIILDKCGWKCVECGKREELTIDHIKPFRKLHSKNRHVTLNDWQNCQVLCTTCHTHKNNGGELYYAD